MSALSPPVEQMAAVTLTNVSEEAQFSKRVLIRTILGRPDGGAGLAGQKVRVGGWVKIGREQDNGSFAFLELNDGSCPANLPVIVDATDAPLAQLVHTGTCMHVEGDLKVPAEGTKEKRIELRVQKVLDLGTVDPARYRLPKNSKLTPEFLRDCAHLRPRTNIISAVARIRNALAYATHTFFQKHGFLYVHTPIVTTSDCEGAGGMFQVTTLIKNPPPTEADVESAKLLVKDKGEAVAQLKSAKASKHEISASVAELNKAEENLSKLEERSKLKPDIPQIDGKIDYSQDFFARQAFLTVSGQLQVETFACALSSVYTFGPAFRAGQSHTSTRHLAEFWMVEPEIAFADLEDDMNCAEAYVKFLCQWLIDNCLDDMEFMVKTFDEGAIKRLQMVASTNFVHISYTEAVAILEEVSKERQFENKVEWGIDLASEHERYLTEVKFKSPVIVYNYPKGIKAFYMKVNADNKTSCYGCACTKGG